jgi:enoyl-CoA hydratase
MTGAEPEVRFIAHGAVAQLVLNRPAKRNAVNPAMARLLEEAVDRLERSPGFRVGVLSGEGDAAFCAGADLGYISRGEGARLSTARGGFAGFVRYPRRKPIIAAVQGYALAGGFEIALACDLLVAERTARFGLPEVTRGLIANGGGLLRLASSVPRARALDLILTGRTMAAPEAAELGLVSRVAEPGQGVSEALGLAGEIAANSPAAVRESLFVANAAAYVPSAQTWELCAEIAQRLRAGGDAIEGATAFLERRDPAWTDHQ